MHGVTSIAGEILIDVPAPESSSRTVLAEFQIDADGDVIIKLNDAHLSDHLIDVLTKGLVQNLVLDYLYATPREVNPNE